MRLLHLTRLVSPSPLALLGPLALTAQLGLLGCGSADAGAFDDPGPGGAEDSGGVVDDVGRSDSTSATDSSAGADTHTSIDSGTTATDARPSEDTAVVAIDTAVPDLGTDVPITRSCTVASAKVFGGHCYFRIEARNFDDAKDGCAAFSATTHLVSIGSDGEQTVAASLGIGLERWIGLSKDFTAPATKASYKWITGEPSTFEHWAPAEPNGSGSCVRLLPDDTWGDRDCFSTITSICEEE